MSITPMVYQPTGFSLEIFQKKYTLYKDETWDEACLRVASHIAVAESGDVLPKWRSAFYQAINCNLFMPGGRIWYGAGRPKGQCCSCYALNAQDSREGWGDVVRDMIIISGTGGGVGINCSGLRPRGSTINGTGGTSTGSVSLMEIVNAAGGVIKDGGNRRSALLFGLNINHGDIQEFLDKKLDLKQLTNANISILFNENPEEFFKKVKADEDFDLIFRGRSIGKVNAKTIWLKIVSNALTNGEPGILNLYLANKMSNIGYWKSLVITNPCAELFLTEYEACCLGSLVLPRFLDDIDELDWDLLKETINTAVRFLDDVITVNYYPTPIIAETCRNLRRIGLGVMGLHDMLLRKGLSYGSDKGLEFVDKLMNFIKNAAYEASISLAIEKGSFPQFDNDKFIRSGFIKTLRPTLRSSIKENGIRNCGLLTCPPTGTTSLVCGVSSSVEPIFAVGTVRRYKDGEDYKEETIIHPLFKKFVLEKRDTGHFQGAHDLDIEDHLEMQRICQRHVDGAIAKTTNVSGNVDVQKVSSALMNYFEEIKGITLYPSGSRENQPLTALTKEQVIKLIEEGNEITGTTEGQCRLGTGECG